MQDYGSAASPCSPASPDLLSYPYTPGCYTVGGYSYTPIGSRDSHRLLSNEDTRCSTPDGTYEELVGSPEHIHFRTIHMFTHFSCLISVYAVFVNTVADCRGYMRRHQAFGG